jgi:hypothetical protein
VSPFWRMLPVMLVIVWATIIIVPLLALLLLGMLPIFAPIFNPAMCISTVDDIMQVSVIPAMPLIVLLWWSDAAGRVRTGTVPVVIFVTPIFVPLVMDCIRYGCCILHRLEAFDMLIDFFIIFGQMRCNLINEHPSRQSIVGWYTVNLLSWVFDPIDFLMDRS